MKKALILFLIAGALLTMLVVGAVTGGALAYFLTRTNTVQAAEQVANLQQSNQSADPGEGGVLVASVNPDSPADLAGIVRGDILLAVGDTPVNSLHDLLVALAEQAEAGAVAITLQHGDEQRTVTVPFDTEDGPARLGIETCDLMFGKEMLPPDLRGEDFVMPLMSNGALVTQVIAGSPAEAAGLQQGDVITAVDDQEISPEVSLADRIQAYQPGDEIVLIVERPDEGEPLELTVELAENPEDSSLPYLGIRYTDNVGLFSRGERIIPFEQFPFELPEGLLPEGENLPFFGQPFSGVIPGMPFNLPEDIQEGVIVVAVTPGSPAEEAGLQEGDVIVSAGGEAVADPQALVTIVQALEPGDELLLELYRQDESEALFVAVTLAENPDQEGTAYLGVRIGEFIRMNESIPPESGFFENFPFPPSEDRAPQSEDQGQSA
jgi:S1-C subfamily serine protease